MNWLELCIYANSLYLTPREWKLFLTRVRPFQSESSEFDLQRIMILPTSDRVARERSIS